MLREKEEETKSERDEMKMGKETRRREGGGQ